MQEELVKKKDTELKVRIGIVCLWSNKDIFVTKIDYLHSENNEESVAKGSWLYCVEALSCELGKINTNRVRNWEPLMLLRGEE